MEKSFNSLAVEGKDHKLKRVKNSLGMVPTLRRYGDYDIFEDCARMSK